MTDLGKKDTHPNDRLGRWAVALYRLSLHAFSSSHLDRYALEMIDAFDQEVRARRATGGSAAALTFTGRACLDSVRAGFGERRRRGRSNPSRMLLPGLRHDVTHAVRGLARSWIFTGVSVLSLSCGLGIAMALFLLLRQTLEPPFLVDQDGLAEVLVVGENQGVQEWSYPDFVDVSEAVGSARLAGWARSDGMLSLGEDSEGRQIRTAYVSSDYLDVLGLTPLLGRGFTGSDRELAGSTPVVITENVWESWLASDPDVIGRVLTIDRKPHVVIGVAPMYFRGHTAGMNAHVFVPLERHPALSPDSRARFDRSALWLGVLGRVTSGASIDDADSAVSSAVAGLAGDHPETNASRRGLVLPYRWQGAEPSNVEGLVIRSLFSGVQGLVLLIVCLNIAGMVLVRSATREPELALRIAMGSSRGRLIQYLLAESVVIGLAGGLLVIGVLNTGLGLLAQRVGPLPQNIAINTQVVAVCLGLSLAASMAFGLLPALRFSRASLVSSMRDAGGEGRKSGRIHRLAVAGQVALAIPVLVVAGSVTRGANSMTTAEYGVRTDGLIVSDRLDLAVQGYDAGDVQRFAQSVRDGVSSLPGVTAVTVSDHTPLDGARPRISVTSPATGSTDRVRTTRVDEHFFEAMEIPIVRGRAISQDDVRGGESVLVATRSLADRLFPGEDPIGQRLALQGLSPRMAAETSGGAVTQDFTIIGVAEEVAGAFLESDTDNLFLSYWQQPGEVLTVSARTTSSDEALATAVAETFVSLDAALAAPTIRPFSVVIEDRGRDMPVWSVFFTVISGLLLGLSALGIYGIVAFSVARRTREIGVRMSLGSSRGRVLKSVLWDAVKIATPGLILGSVLGAVIGLRILNQMYVQIGLPMAEPGIMLAGAAGAFGIVLVASISPARRAASVDPMEALRAE